MTRLLLLAAMLFISFVAPVYGDLVVADSFVDWSTTGTQGENNWFNGYYNLTLDGDGSYATTDLQLFKNDGSNVPETTPFEVNHWNGVAWDFETSPPWTFLGQERVDPNGTNNVEERWTVRRWESDQTGLATINWDMRKQTPNGDGVTGILFVNGVEVDRATISGGDTTGVSRSISVPLSQLDLIDLALSPEGIGGRTDGGDVSLNRLTVSISAVPEPSAFLCLGLVGLVAGGLDCFKRRRRTAKLKHSHV